MANPRADNDGKNIPFCYDNVGKTTVSNLDTVPWRGQLCTLQLAAVLMVPLGKFETAHQKVASEAEAVFEVGADPVIQLS